MDDRTVKETRDYIAYELEGMVDDLVYGALDRVHIKLEALRAEVDGRLPVDDDRLMLLDDLLVNMKQTTTPNGQPWRDFDKHKYFLFEAIGMLYTNYS